MIRSVTQVVIPALVFFSLVSSANAQAKKVSVTSVTPASGAPGTEITISGSNFDPEVSNNRVFLNKARLKLVSVFPNSIKAVIPSKAESGTISVQTRKNGNASAPKPFTVLIPLTIKAVSAKVATPGAQLAVRGTGFESAPQKNKVTLGGKPCKVVRAAATELVFEVPKKAKSGKLKIAVPERAPVEFPHDITVAEQPVILKLLPTSGRPGDTVTIRGSYFGSDASAVEVRVGAVPVKVISVKEKEIKVELTPGSRSGAVQLAVSGIKSEPSRQSFTVEAPLRATKMEPTSVSPGDEVRIYGTGFSDRVNDHVLVIDNKKVVAKEATPAYVAFTVPKTVGGGQHKVRLDVKKLGTINIPVPLAVVQQLAVTRFSPESGPGGSTVTIYGENFGTSPNDIRVFIGRQLARVTSVSPNSIVVNIPPNAATSRFTVQSRHNGTAVTDDSFVVGVPLSVTTFTPSSGRPNQQVRIYGSGFSPSPKQNQVTLGKVSVPVLQAAPNNLLVQIPENAASGRFRVAVSGMGAAETKAEFQVLKPAPASAPAGMAITAITPESGSVGTYVRIAGSGFSADGMRAYVGRTPAGIRVYSATQAMIAIPANATGGPITLMLPTGARATSKQSFQVTAELSVNKFYPLSGRPGAQVTIYGNEFEPGKTKVYLGSTELPVAPGGNNTMLQVTVPETAQSGPFRVAVPGKKEARSVGAFKVLPPITTFKPEEQPKAESVLASKPDDTPVIEKLMSEAPKEAIPSKSETPEKAPTMDELLGFETDGEKLELKSFDPPEGVAGDTIMINGSGFGDDPKKVQAWIGDKKADIVGCVPDMIMLEVPKGASTGRIKLRIGGKPPLTSTKDFTVK